MERFVDSIIKTENQHSLRMHAEQIKGRVSIRLRMPPPISRHSLPPTSVT